MSTIKNIIKGDSVEFECSTTDNITGWKIRCEIYDDINHSIKKATANSGGSDSQIKITDALNGKFSIYILKGETTKFSQKSFIEIAVTTPDEKSYTVYQDKIEFKSQRIKWTTP